MNLSLLIAKSEGATESDSGKLKYANECIKCVSNISEKMCLSHFSFVFEVAKCVIRIYFYTRRFATKSKELQINMCHIKMTDAWKSSFGSIYVFHWLISYLPVNIYLV